jgi:hypothetical protein
MSDLNRRALRHGTKSKYAGDEPRNRELTEHWPKPKPLKFSKRALKQKRKDRANKRADEKAYQARVTSPWPIVAREKGGQ